MKRMNYMVQLAWGKRFRFKEINDIYRAWHDMSMLEKIEFVDECVEAGEMEKLTILGLFGRKGLFKEYVNHFAEKWSGMYFEEKEAFIIQTEEEYDRETDRIKMIRQAVCVWS